MEQLKKELSYECGYGLSDTLFSLILDASTEIHLKKGAVLYEASKTNTDVYILKEGILRLWFYDGIKERTHAFALPATLMISYHSYFMGLPSYIQVDACTDSVLLKMTKGEFDTLIKTSHEFAVWAAFVHASQLFYYEKKLAVINGTAIDRFIALMDSRPEIVQSVASRIVASYLGITPQYFSHIKRRFYLKQKI